MSDCPSCGRAQSPCTRLSTQHGVFMTPGAREFNVDGGDLYMCECGNAILYEDNWFEQSSRRWLTLEQRELLITMRHLVDDGLRVTWKLLGERMDITPNRARRLGGHLRNKGHIDWHGHIGKHLTFID